MHSAVGREGEREGCWLNDAGTLCGTTVSKTNQEPLTRGQIQGNWKASCEMSPILPPSEHCLFFMRCNNSVVIGNAGKGMGYRPPLLRPRPWVFMSLLQFSQCIGDDATLSITVREEGKRDLLSAAGPS